MARPFYPFVDNDPESGPATPAEPEPSPQMQSEYPYPTGDMQRAQTAPQGDRTTDIDTPQSATAAHDVASRKPKLASRSYQGLSASEVEFPARIAVYDDAAAAPRVVIIDPKDVRSYLEEITRQVTALSHEQGGTIPFTVIREIVENFIHAYFIEPTISILDGGNTIRFSDQGPGIKEKARALEYGTSSATEEMKRYIRGVGSGLPYVQQYMEDKGGSLTVEDNISQGTIVTISTRRREDTMGAPTPDSAAAQVDGNGDAMNQQPQNYQMSSQGAAMGAVAYPYSIGQASPAPNAWTAYSQQTYPQQGYPQQAQPNYPQDPYQRPYQPGAYQPYPQQQISGAYPQGGYPQPYVNPTGQTRPQPPITSAADTPAAAGATEDGRDPFSWISLSPRGRAALAYLAHNGSVGPSDLQRAYGESQPTWTRELKQLEEDGLVKKDGQKRRLTGMGRAFIDSHPLG